MRIFCGFSAPDVPQLRAALGSDTPRILIKRDDLTGFAFGGKLLGATYRVHAVSVGGSAHDLRNQMTRLAEGTANLLGVPPVIGPDDFDVYDDYIGERYGLATPATLEAIRLTARTDAIFLDPVYTGKAMSGMIGEIRKGRVKTDDVAVFVHTGGVPIIFAYHDVLKDL